MLVAKSVFLRTFHGFCLSTEKDLGNFLTEHSSETWNPKTRNQQILSYLLIPGDQISNIAESETRETISSHEGSNTS